jgi:hypothetical protein
MLIRYTTPFDVYRRYISATGDYPASVTVKTPTGALQLMTYSHHDLLTVNESFCREDYKADNCKGVVVNFGSNISSAYFLSRSTTSFAYLFEPLSRNVERLATNLAAFKGCYARRIYGFRRKSGIVETSGAGERGIRKVIARCSWQRRGGDITRRSKESLGFADLGLFIEL